MILAETESEHLHSDDSAATGRSSAGHRSIFKKSPGSRPVIGDICRCPVSVPAAVRQSLPKISHELPGFICDCPLAVNNNASTFHLRGRVLFCVGCLRVSGGSKLQLATCFFSQGEKLAPRSKLTSRLPDDAGTTQKEGNNAAFRNYEDQYPREVAWIYAILATSLIGLTGVLPLFLPFKIAPQNSDAAGAAKFNCILSFAVGGLLGDVFLHLLPEAWAHISANDYHGHTVIGLWILVGMLVFLSLEKIFGENGDHGDEQKESKKEFCGVDGNKRLPTKEKVMNGSHKVSNASRHVEQLTSNQQTRAADSVAKKRKTTKSNVSTKITSSKVQKNGITGTQQQSSQKNGFKGHQGVQTSQKNRINACQREGTQSSAEKTEQETQKKIKVVGYLNLLANFIDNFTHGIAVAGSFLISKKVGFLTTAAILVHEVPHEVGDFAILLKSGFTRWQAAKSQISTALGGLLGAMVTLLCESAKEAGERSAWILPFTAGGFLYIAMVTVLPDLLQESSPRESIRQVVCLLAGIAVMAAVSLVVE
ncbi:zinc transporter ZIP13-like [Diadema antillarum]|uniref:zinc transporter ZIP13-like n=1 Tax=Diadema antillarum TaxID=105358 RepID=UPI003A8BA2B5